jgi:anti-sigma regulatory factor (Ser/Thr protein kinase)/uncharacterized protein YigA (DUF484 family)
MPPTARSSASDERLRLIEPVTDAVLAHLDTQDLLVELLGRVRDLLRSDTVTLLLLDPTSRYLVATATCGLEEEVQQGFRLPVGHGFAGRVAEKNRPVVIDEVDSDNVVNPMLRAKGVRSLLGVPLRTDGTVTGVLHIGSLTPRRFTDDDTGLLQLLADRIALVTRVQHTQAEKTAAAILQRSLLPIPPAKVLGMDLATRYVAGGMGSVGGDWYDLFTLPSGELGVVIGDVAGNGLRAAVVMGRLRSALRAYALDHADPAEVLARLDRKVQHFEPGIMATVLFGRFDPAAHQFRVSLAGHPPPVLALPGQEATVLDLPPDPPLGVRTRAARRATTVAVPPGALVCLYTDGLIERRGRSLDDGLEALRRVVTVAPAETVCASVMTELVGSAPPDDDVALLVMRGNERDDTLDLEFSATPDSLRKIRGTVTSWLTTAGCASDEVGDLVIAVHEACSNVVEHAYGPAGGSIFVRLAALLPDLLVTVRDTGSWRPPRGTHRGRGKRLMEHCCDELHIDHGADGTVVTIRRRMSGQEEHA